MALPDCIIASPPKTGSTILTRMVNQHPQITTSHESYITMPYFVDSIANPDSRKARWHDMPRKTCLGVREAVEARRYGVALSLVADHMRQRTGAPVAVESWPFWGPYLPLLRKLCPDPLIVVMLRDPRAQWWSAFKEKRGDKGDRKAEQIADGQTAVQDETIEHLLGDVDPAKAERRVQKLLGLASPDAMREVIDSTRARAQSHGRHPTEHVLRLEDFVEDPEREVRRIWARLGLDPDEGWHAYRSDMDPMPERWSWIPGATSHPEPRRVHAWRQQMPLAQQRLISDPRAQMMAAWGYDAESAHERQAVVEHFMQGGSLGGDVNAEHEVREAMRQIMHDIGRMGDESEASQKAMVSDEHEYDRLERDPYWRGHGHGFALGKDTACASMRHALLRAQARALGEDL